MILTKAQKEIAKSKARFRVLRCGRRFGKTTLAVEEMVGKAVSKDDQKIVYIAPTYQQARDICWTQLKKKCLPITIKSNEQRLEIIVQTQEGGTSQIVLRGWESVDTLRGQRFDMLVADEVRDMRYWNTNWNEVLRPTLLDSKGVGMFISTPRGFDHFYELSLEEDNDPDYKTFHFTTYDNPHMPKDEIEKMKVEMTDDQFAQEVLADFRKHTGLIYKEFDRTIHVIEPFQIPAVWQHFRAMDFGADNPTVCLWIAIDSPGNIYVYDEYYQSGLTTQSHVNIISAKGDPANDILVTYGDPSAEQERLDYASMGIVVTPANKLFNSGDGWVNSGIDAVRQKLKLDPQTQRPKLYLLNNCVKTIKEFETYRWREALKERNTPQKPEKTNDHCMDALRYFVVSYRGKVRKFRPPLIVKYNKTTGY
jgi:PBSX family phage terminase large subunit